MAQQLVNIGSSPDDGTGDTGRAAFKKVNDNFTELYGFAQVNYTAITTDTYAITDAELVVGTNIFGVNYAGAVAITLPDNIASTKIIVVNDESGDSNTNNITLTVA